MKARLLAADRSDKEIELSAMTVATVGDRHLLWVDATLTGKPAQSHDLLALLPFDPEAWNGCGPRRRGPRLLVYGDHFLVGVVVLRPHKDRDDSVVLDLAVGKMSS